jgi:hypothetical protein
VRAGADAGHRGQAAAQRGNSQDLQGRAGPGTVVGEHLHARLASGNPASESLFSAAVAVASGTS